MHGGLEGVVSQVVGELVRKKASKPHWYGIADLLVLLPASPGEMEPVLESLKPCSLSGRDGTMLSGMNATGTGRLAHNGSNSNCGPVASQTRIAIVEATRRLVLVWDG